MSQKYVVEVSEDHNGNGFFILIIVIGFLIAGVSAGFFSCDNVTITMNPQEITMSAGEVYIVNSIVGRKNKELEWTINDTSVAEIVSIDGYNCTIRAIKQGETYVKASYKNNSDRCQIKVIGSITSNNSVAHLKDKKCLGEKTSNNLAFLMKNFECPLSKYAKTPMVYVV